MKRAKVILRRLIYPPKLVYSLVPVSFIALIFIFAAGSTEGIAAYVFYTLSAYSLVLLLAILPRFIAVIKGLVSRSRIRKKILSTAIGGRYVNDLSFRGSVSIYQGMTVNFLYMLFRIVTGIKYASVWFISMAVYYMVLGVVRTYLIMSYRRADRYHGAARRAFEYNCYRRTALSLFLLNIPMGGMIVLMIVDNSGYSYPGMVIYLSAMYTFYSMISSLTSLWKYSRLGSPVLSAARVLNVISAMMSVLGLQTAMITRFSENSADYRRMMNTITGGCVYTIVIFIAIFMLVRAFRHERSNNNSGT